VPYVAAALRAVRRAAGSQLSEKYKGYADVLNDEWPRTAAVLRRIAEVYASEARREDVEAELREDLWR